MPRDIVENLSDYNVIRDYLRRFYIYGFESREELSQRLQKSKSDYRDNKRGIEDWLHKYMDFQGQERRYFITVDTSQVSHNPLYDIWKAKEFTGNDIMLHFYLLDMFRFGQELSTVTITNRLNDEYVNAFENVYVVLPDSTTIRNKLDKYCKLGILHKRNRGRDAYYSMAANLIDTNKWQSACDLFSEITPLGEVGSYLLDGFPEYNCFGFKHHFFLYSLDSAILYELLVAINSKRNVVIKPYYNSDGVSENAPSEILCCPLRFYFSTQTGRRYVLCYDYEQQKLAMLRLDKIASVAMEKLCAQKDYEHYLTLAKEAAPHIWGVSLFGDGSLEHLEFTVQIGENEKYIVERLQREKRGGTVTQLDAEHYRFSIDVYDARELLPWLRSFIMRITDFQCSNDAVKQTFMQDLQNLMAYYSEEAETDGAK